MASNFEFLFEFKDGQVCNVLGVLTWVETIEDGLKWFADRHERWGDKLYAYRCGNEVKILDNSGVRADYLKLHGFV